MNTLTEQETNSQPTARKPGISWQNLRTFLPNLLLSWLVPLLAYELISPHVHSDLVALAISAAVPALVTLGTFLFHRRVNVIGLIGVAGFAVGVAISVLSGGSELAFKLQDPVLSGAIGLVFVGSVVIGRPLLLVVHRLRTRGTNAPPVTGTHKIAVLTGLLGVTLLVHAIVITVLALTLPTSTFLALSRPIGLPILVIGIGALFWYVRRSAAHSQPLSQQGK
jgi:hypothetical protein